MAKKRFAISFDAPIVWAAAAAAQRVNNGYIKVTSIPEGSKVETNRQLLDMFVGNPSLIKEEDHALGLKVRNYYKGFMLKMLAGTRLSDFDNSAMEVSSKDTITTNFEIAIICALPASYFRAVEKDNNARRLAFANGGFLSIPGEKVRVENAEVIKSIYSHNYNTYFITIITPENQAVFFSYREGLMIGSRLTVAGTVKAHKDNATQLNRVKVIEIVSSK